jgi:MFS family permease
MGADATPGWFTRGVRDVAAASFLSDAGHEMATSVLPTFLTTTLGAGPAALGAVEGVSDALIGVSKLAGGPLAADPARRGRVASGGYLVTAVATSAIGLATAVWQVGALRAVAWVSRGVRGPARDTLLMSLVPREAYGRASGAERAGDNAGAILGPLVASGLVAVIGVRHIFLLALVPGLLAAAAIAAAAREARRTVTAPSARRTLALNLGELRRAGLPRALAPATLFEIGNVATTLLILRATEMLASGGRTATAAASLAILMYAAHNGAATVSALTGGHLTDRVGPRFVLGAGAACYVVAYVAFAADGSAWAVVLGAFVLAGVGIGLVETAETTTVALALPDRLRGNGYGVLGLIQSFGDLGASLVVGLLWAAVSPAVAFGYAATWMLASVLASALTRSRRGLGGTLG